MKTVKLKGLNLECKEYAISERFVDTHVFAYAAFIYASYGHIINHQIIKDSNINLPSKAKQDDWLEVGRLIKKIIPSADTNLIDLNDDYGLYLNFEDHKALYSALVESLSERGYSTDVNIPDISEIKTENIESETIESERKRLQARLKEIGG